MTFSKMFRDQNNWFWIVMQVVPTDVNLASKPNVTVPKEPNLQTAVRAQRHKYINYF